MWLEALCLYLAHAGQAHPLGHREDFDEVYSAWLQCAREYTLVASQLGWA